MPIQAKSLYAVLYYRGDNVSWHWTFFVPEPSPDDSGVGSSGTVFDASNDNADKEWVYGLKSEGIIVSDRVVLVVKLADLSSWGTYPEVVSGIASVLEAIPVIKKAVRGEFNCRMWFLAGITALNEAGYISCDNVVELGKEIRNAAMLATPKYLDGSGRTIITAEYCS